MDLTINKADFKNHLPHKSTKELKAQSANTILQKEINLNNNPVNIYFKGLFSKSAKKQTPQKLKEEGFYGPYKLTKSQTDANNYAIYDIVNETITSALFKATGKKEITEKDKTTRLKDKAVKDAVPVCISEFAHKQRRRNNFPEFYDAIVRAFPAACAEIDNKYMCDNASRLYEAVMEKIIEYGENSDPKAEDLIKAGIKYLYSKAGSIPVYEIILPQKETPKPVSNKPKEVIETQTLDEFIDEVMRGI